MPVEVFVANEQSEHDLDCERWARLAREVLQACKVRGAAELSVLFVDQASIAALNERFLGHPGPTDVLSFPIDEAPVASGRDPDASRSSPSSEGARLHAPSLLGDVVICPAVAFANAPGHAGTFEDEIALLLVHGILHLLGMDHEIEAEAELMEARETELLAAHYRPLARGDG